MALVAAEHEPWSRKRVLAVHLQHGVIGMLALVAATFIRRDEPAAVIAALGQSGPLLIVLFFLFSVILALLKFKLTEEIFVSLAVTVYMAMAPLLGLVLSAWIAVLAAAAQRILSMRRIGPQHVDMRDSRFEWARTFALFATYGIPVIVAVKFYEVIGGTVPLLEPSGPAALRITACGIVLVLANNLIVARVERAYGYSISTTLKTAVIDTSIYLVTIPYAILTAFAYGSIGWGGVLASAFTWIIANVVARNLAQVRVDREQLIQRLASLTNIGKTISLNFTTDELLMQVFTECRKVMDVSMFGIALHDASTNELSFELSVVDGEVRPKVRLPLTDDGLNSWVFHKAQPLLIGSSSEERKLGVTSLDDGLQTESWMGVPMIARDHVIGIISMQSFKKNAFTQGDLVLLTAIANQTAAAIENAHLYRDLEGLNIALEHRVHERTNELRETNLRLIAADSSKNQFLASMSHELRTPLNAIIGFSSILLNVTQTVLPARLYKMVENIRTAGSHLLDLINDILDLAKIETGKLQLELQPFDLRETIATVDRVIKGMAAERDVAIITKLDPALATAHLDEVRLKQILLNLLSNAVKFSQSGGFVY
ncbi:MAG TPA: histidine kinase dimerization/phospho-acceptor domain-containing protein, partial [Thermoanaerobaculia bacterium]|nr:histidine kinase dimerization/phospho-acceptor domain-containing protein [Thermoanaerobaculia bacterium]